MKNKTLEPKTDPQPNLSPYQAERAEAQQTLGLRPGPVGATLAPPCSEATFRAHAANVTRATAGRTLRRLQRQYGNRYVQRVVAQRQGGAEGFQLDDETAGRINRARGGGQPLDGAVQAQMSEALGHDFSGVRVHTDTEADKLNQQLQAKAFTTGPDIFFVHGAYDPASSGGRELIAHELSHVVQQNSGRVHGGGSGMTVRPACDAFEQEADALARKAASAEPAASAHETGQGTNILRSIKERRGETEGPGSTILLVQREKWEGPADFYYEGDDEEQEVQRKRTGSTINTTLQCADSQEDNQQQKGSPPPHRKRHATREGHPVVQRAYVVVGPLAKKGGGWHFKRFKRAFRGKPVSIESHPNRHGMFHAHIVFEDGKEPSDIGWGRRGNPGYKYDKYNDDTKEGHDNTFEDRTGRPYEADEKGRGLNDASVRKAMRYIQKLWRGQDYSLLNRNCQHFVASVVAVARMGMK